jgi:hypothetical protein
MSRPCRSSGSSKHRENSREIVLVNEWWRGSGLVLGERDLWKLIRQAFDDE